MRGLFGLTVEEHAIFRTSGPMQFLPVYLVDNVITTGTTMAACRRALCWGTGLAYSDAEERIESDSSDKRFLGAAGQRRHLGRQRPIIGRLFSFHSRRHP
jgi:hypothetical protein